MFKLLSSPITNQKAKKNLDLKVHTYFLSLAHSDTSGYNTCPSANRVTINEKNPKKSNCSSVCVAKNGNGNFPNVKKSRINKTIRFFEDRENFLNDLVFDVFKAVNYSIKKGFEPTFRLNAYSDIKWENIKIKKYDSTIFELFPFITFYDYSKISNRKTLFNYELTYSHYGLNEVTKEQIKQGYNVAMVFNKNRTEDLPKMYQGLKVVDGDKTDLRTIKNDGQNVIVGLRAKMSKKNMNHELTKKRGLKFLVNSNSIEHLKKDIKNMEVN